MKNKKPKIDVEVINAGSIIQFHPKTKAAREWINENVESEGYQWMGPTLCVEARYAEDLANGMQSNGLILQ